MKTSARYHIVSLIFSTTLFGLSTTAFGQSMPIKQIVYGGKTTTKMTGQLGNNAPKRSCVFEAIITFRGDKAFLADRIMRCSDGTDNSGEDQGAIFTINKSVQHTKTCNKPDGSKIETCSDGTKHNRSWTGGRRLKNVVTNTFHKTDKLIEISNVSSTNKEFWDDKTQSWMLAKSSSNATLKIKLKGDSCSIKSYLSTGRSESPFVKLKFRTKSISEPYCTVNP